MTRLSAAKIISIQNLLFSVILSWCNILRIITDHLIPIFPCAIWSVESKLWNTFFLILLVEMAPLLLAVLLIKNFPFFLLHFQVLSISNAQERLFLFVYSCSNVHFRSKVSFFIWLPHPQKWFLEVKINYSLFLTNLNNQTYFSALSICSSHSISSYFCWFEGAPTLTRETIHLQLNRWACIETLYLHCDLSKFPPSF